VISDHEKPIHPSHRPPYTNAIPIVDIIRSVKGIKSATSKTVLNEYERIIKNLGVEFTILIDLPLDKIEDFDTNIAKIIEALRNDEIQYTPGGGGTYGEIKFDL
jgi:PHP family Zn ribbon phosphoesterase